MPDNYSDHGFASNPRGSDCRCRGLHRHVTWLVQLYIKRLSCGKATRKSVRVGRAARLRISLSTPLGGAPQISYTKTSTVHIGACRQWWGRGECVGRRRASSGPMDPGEHLGEHAGPGASRVRWEPVGVMGNGCDGQPVLMGKRPDGQTTGRSENWSDGQAVVGADLVGEQS